MQKHPFGVFIVNFKQITPYSGVFIVEFGQDWEI